MADNNYIPEDKRKEAGMLSEEERAEKVRHDAKRIASQILTLTRNGLFVSLRFLDLALCQFEYISTEKIEGIATTGQHIVYNSRYIIESYMRDRQALSRDYLHMVLHCVFRHPFVSENLHQEYWNLAADIAVETIIDELDLKQTATQNCGEVSQEVARIKKLVKQVTAEHVYQLLLSGAVANKDIERWRKLFYRDDHRIWWEIARQIAEEMERRRKEEQETPEADEQRGREGQEGDDEDENQEGEEQESPEEDAGDGEDQEESAEDGEDESADDQDSDEAEDSGQEGGEDSEGDGEEDQPDDGEDSEESEESEEEDAGDGGSEDGSEGDDGLQEEEFEEEYSSTPGQTTERENPDDLADPDSDTRESDRGNNDDGSGGGKPDDNPQQSEDEGSSRKNDQTGEGLEGQDDHHKPEDKNNGADSLSGSTDEGRRDDSPGEDPFSQEQQHQNNQALSDGGSNRKSPGSQGQKSAGTGGGGDGSQSAWEHESGGANRREGGEKDEENRRQLQGSANPEDEQEISSDDQQRQEAVPTEASREDSDQEREPSYMHGESEREELKDKWKDISERMLVDLQTSSKEWGDKSDTMLQGVKKLNRDKYDYSTFLRKFATMREDIQINPDEFDYVYYTYGMQRYGNIPLIEPLEYKEVKKVRDFVIAIDTSGSCAGEVVQKFLDKTYSLFTQQENFFKKINLHIIQCDAEIQSDVKITCREEFDDYVRDLEFRGFGGTDFRPVFEYVNDMIEQGEFDDLKGLIYFTDGNGTYPKKRPPYETAFVFVDDDEFEYEVPSWAMKLVLETTDIMEEVLI